MSTYPVIEHREGRWVSWLRARRLRIGLLVALVEALLIAFDVIDWRWALLAAALVFAFYLFVGRKAENQAVRQLSWAAALSQTIPVLAPIVVAVVATFVIVALAAFALVILVMLLLDRR